MNRFERAREEYQKQQMMGEAINMGFSEGFKKSTIKENDNLKRYDFLTRELRDIYAKKNADYGDSFNHSLNEDGLLVAKIRLGDKYKRFCQLIKNPAEVTEEKLRDTLMDMANYAKMTVMWMDTLEEAEAIEKVNKLGEPGGIVCGYNFKKCDGEPDFDPMLGPPIKFVNDKK